MHLKTFSLSLLILGLGTALTAFTAQAQHAGEPLVDRKPDSGRETAHREGLHVNPVAAYAIVGAVVHRSPTAEPQVENVLVSDGKILAVGPDIEIPAGARRVDVTGSHLYAGFMDGFTETEIPFTQKTGTAYWNDNVRPQVSVRRDLDFSKLDSNGMRSAGFTAALVAPKDGIIKGNSAFLLLGSADSNHALVKSDVAQHTQLTVARGRGRGKYPNSPMGAYALARQAMYDAQWYRDATQVAKANATAERPENNQALAALQPAIAGDQPVVIETSNELFALRAVRFSNEFGLNSILLGSGNEYRRIKEIKATGRSIILPLNFPNAPDVSSPDLARDVNLESLMHWDHAPSNPAVLEGNEIDFIFTTKGLKNKKDSLKNLRKAVQRGLSKTKALHGLTLGVAELFKVDDQLGTVEPNKIANFTLLDGDLFSKSAKVVGVVVDGKHFDFGHQHQNQPMIDGAWQISNERLAKYNLVLKKSKKELSGYFTKANAEPNGKKEDDSDKAIDRENDTANEEEKEKADSQLGDNKEDDAKPKPESKVKLSALKQFGGRITGNFKLPNEQESGVYLFSVMFADDETGLGQLTSPQGEVSEFTLKPVDEWAREVNGHQHNKPAEADKSKSFESAESNSNKKAVGDQKADNDEVDDANSDSDGATGTDDNSKTDGEKTPADKVEPKSKLSSKPSDETATATAKPSSSVSFPVNYPLGAYGVTEPPELPGSVLIKNVTIWTLDNKGKIDDGAILFGGGKIQTIFDLKAEQPLPDADLVIDGEGGHVTPGIIDCHSHMATDSGVNESGQAITAEVRIGDMIDPDDITIYRQLAGGVTSSNILHGSANPIGGQNQIIKLRWGANEEDIKFADAPLGIKFALGENVKQSNRPTSTTRYPQTRMGVQQIIDDALRAAEDYNRRREAYRRDRSGLPPQRDLELDALVEICKGKRWIHCHSYRQDEILALIRTLESHDIQIGSFQHILEGYKVADEMFKHGATASSFADWWAYKYEVKDAIPYAGAMMHNSGLVVSFNSDDRELGRRLNQEAAKAVRYGGVDEIEALKFVTLNPAKQLRIDDKVGSLEPDKDADLVLWSGHPLSNLSRVRQTWVDGRKYFDIDEDLKRRKENQRQRNTLIQKILTSGAKMEAKNKDTSDPAKLWPRYDEFCGHHDHSDDDGNNLLHSDNEFSGQQQTQQGASHE